MAKISTYAIDASPQLNDKVIGTDVNDENKTKNYTIGDILGLLPPVPSVVTDLFVPISNGSDYVDSIISQDSTTTPTYVNIGGLVYQNIKGSTYFGLKAGESDDLSGNNSVGVGQNVLQSQVTGSFGGVQIPSENVGVGYFALNSTTTGTNNVAIGSEVLSLNNTGFNNVGISKNALGPYTTNSTSIGIGFSAGNPAATSGSPAGDGHSGNTMVGHQAMADFDVIPGAIVQYNVALGFRALRGLGGPSQGASKLSDNVVIGRQAGLNIKTTDDLSLENNVFLGQNAGFGLNNGKLASLSYNLLLGASAGQSQFIADNNIVLASNTASNKLGKDVLEPRAVSANIIIGGSNDVFASDNIVISNNSGNRNTIGNEVDTNTNLSADNIILGSSTSTINNNGANTANKNTIINSSVVDLLASNTSNANDNFVAHSSSIETEGANENVFIQASSSSAALTGTKNIVVGTSNFQVNGNTNILLGTTNADVEGNNNLIVGASGNEVIGSNSSYIFGQNNKVAPTDPTETPQRNFVHGFNNIVKGGNNALIGGSNSEILDGDNNNDSFTYGRGLQSRWPSQATVGRFNAEAAAQAGNTGTLFQVGCGSSANNRANAIHVVNTNNNASIFLDTIVAKNFQDNAAAVAAGLTVGEVYHRDGVLAIVI